MKKLRYSGLVAALVSLASCTSGEYLNYVDPGNKWSICIETCDDAHKEKSITFNGDAEPSVTKDGKDITHTFSGIDGKDITVSFTYAPYAKGKGVQITTKVTNNESGVFVKKVCGPVFSDGSLDLDNGTLYIPTATGTRYNGVPAIKDENGKWKEKNGMWAWNKSLKCYENSNPYPGGRMFMQYWVYCGAEKGLYVASHDPEFTFKRFFVRYYPEKTGLEYGVEQMMTCFTGETYNCPPVIISPVSNDWHDAADIYSEFFHANMTAVEQPEWMNHTTAWMLTIMKQQNNELMWPYNTISREMTQAAKSRGFNMLGLFGWTVGGHDKYYPEYDVDPAMGGYKELTGNIQMAQAQGMKVIIYVNGQLIDTEGTRFWPEHGDSIVVRHKDGSDYHQMWQKYKDFPARHHGMACQSTALWKEKLLELAMQAENYGADGIIFDQLGTTNVTYCYAANHGHTVPAIVYERDKYENLLYVQQEMKKINPNFIVITEGICEAEINSVSMFHLAAGSLGKNCFTTDKKQDDYRNGCSGGTNFGQMVKYTIPEWTSTDRNQSPVLNRMQLNYDVLCGVRPEIEVRYMPDKQYILEGRKSQDDDYTNMISKVDISEIKRLDAEAQALYTKQINEFLLANSDLFFAGRFVDTKGYEFSCDTKYVQSSAFVAGNRMGVVVWNASDDDAAAYTISAKGWNQVSVTAPDAEIEAGAPVAPQSIHLVIFEK